MKYLLLVYGEEEKMQAVDDFHCLALTIDPQERPLRRLGGASAGRDRDYGAGAKGKTSVTDGPFAETKECLAGFYMIEARDLNEAISIASRIPPAQIGSVEIRPIPDPRGANENGLTLILTLEGVAPLAVGLQGR